MELNDALRAEEEGRFIDSLVLCRGHLERSPRDPDAVNLMGRLSRVGGDIVSAIGLQRLALMIAPLHARAKDDLEAVLADIPAAEDGVRAYDDALALEPSIADRISSPLSLRPFEDIDEVQALLESALVQNPALGYAHAALANVLTRRRRFAEAMAEARRAALLEPGDPELLLFLSELESGLGETAEGDRHRKEALATQRLYLTHRSLAKRSLLALLAPGPWPINVALDFLVDPEQTTVHRYYLTGDTHVESLPHYDLVFNAIGESETSQSAIKEAACFIAGQSKPVLNVPEHLAKTARPALGETLRGITGCSVPAAVRVARNDIARVPAADGIAGIAFPLVIRPVDAHSGLGLERLDGPADVAGYLDRFQAERYDVSTFVDYRSEDGFYRKYRVIFVDGKVFPYHLAVASDWKIHYVTSQMIHESWMRDEEERFLSYPHFAFQIWKKVFAEIAAAVNLDYFGIDCAVLVDGEVIIFEADAATWIHRDDEEVFAYKNMYVDRIVAAVESMLDRRIAATS